MDRRATKESGNFIEDSGFKSHDVINTKEQTLLGTIKDVFEGKDIQAQYKVLGYRIDLYFHDYRLAIEVDKFCHKDRDIDYEI